MRLLLALLLMLPQALWAGNVTVFAAASLKTALEQVATQWQAETGHTVTLSFAGSSALARQIEAGAPADIFLSANPGWMDHLAAKGLIRNDSRVDLLGNALVLIGPAGDAPMTLSDLPARLGNGPLAMALIDAVPAGIYGKEALMSLGLWAAIQDRVAQTDNVRAALALVALGEAPLGITYHSDALAEPRVAVLATFPADSHPPITYPAALTSDSTSPQAGAFLAYLQSPEASAILGHAGFVPLTELQ